MQIWVSTIMKKAKSVEKRNNQKMISANKYSIYSNVKVLAKMLLVIVHAVTLLLKLPKNKQTPSTNTHYNLPQLLIFPQNSEVKNISFPIEI